MKLGKTVWLLYRSAFFHGQIEVPRKGTTLWLPSPDLPVLVAINGAGLTVIDPGLSVSKFILNSSIHLHEIKYLSVITLILNYIKK